MERLDKLIANNGTFSRKEVKEMIRKGQVSVNGVCITKAEFKLDETCDQITLLGKPLSIQKYTYLMLHKPTGYISASNDPNAPTVLDLIPPEFFRKGLFPAGRLDKDTTGFLLITNDGEFAHNILSPKKHISKTYIATVDGLVTQEMVDAFQQGLEIDGNIYCRPASLEILSANNNLSVTQVILTEGMYHQIKRMFQTFGLQVIALHRSKMGGLPLDPTLQPGECRPLTPEELSVIKEDVQ